MTLTKADIFKIRKNLNWTKKQLADRLGCSVEILIKAEKGTVQLSSEIKYQLTQLKNQVEYVADQQKKQSFAEKLMSDYNLNQISKEHIDELIEKE